jgi:hypothetical protein
MLALAVVDRPIVNKADGDRAASDSSSHSFTEMQWCTPLECRIDGVVVDVAHRGLRFLGRIGPARAVTRLVFRRWHPTGTQRGKHVLDRIKRTLVRRGVCIPVVLIFISAAFLSASPPLLVVGSFSSVDTMVSRRPSPIGGK